VLVGASFLVLMNFHKQHHNLTNWGPIAGLYHWRAVSGIVRLDSQNLGQVTNNP